MGTIKTTNIETITGSGTLTLGQSGETITIPSGATLDLSNATQTGVGGANTPAFLATMGAQSVSDNTYTVLAFNTEVVDTDSAYDNSTYTFTVPSGKAGLYYFTAMMQAEGVDDGERAQIVFAVNGTRDFTTMARNYAPATDSVIYCTASSILNLSEGSTVVAQVLQASGETQNVGYGQFGGFKIIQ